MILVDYACGTCRTVHERWTPTPPPRTVECRCGAPAARRFAPVGLTRAAAAPAPAGKTSRRPLCTSFPQVPGLCHMSESAGRRWVATYLGDHRRLDREIARQEAAARVRPRTTADAITHQHYADPPVTDRGGDVGES